MPTFFYNVFVTFVFSGKKSKLFQPISGKSGHHEFTIVKYTENKSVLYPFIIDNIKNSNIEPHCHTLYRVYKLL